MNPDRLHDIVEPVAVSWLPQTGGWAVLALLLTAAVGWWAWARYRAWQAAAYRRAALVELEEIPDRFVELIVEEPVQSQMQWANTPDADGWGGDDFADEDGVLLSDKNQADRAAVEALVKRDPLARRRVGQCRSQRYRAVRR